MARPLRLEFPGAIYHLTSRGNAQAPVFLDDADRRAFLGILADTVDRYNWICHAYCLMGNHYHLLVETPDPNLSAGMRQLNGVYTQFFNRVHDRAGHLFQGRYKSILVERGSHLLELCRYIVLNPVKAGLVKRPEQWRWSSYRATAGMSRGGGFLTTDWILGQFSPKKTQARKKYIDFVNQNLPEGTQPPWERLEGRIFFGGSRFIERMREKLGKQKETAEIPKVQRFAGRKPLAELLAGISDKTERNRRICTAHLEHGYTLGQIAGALGIHSSQPGGIIYLFAVSAHGCRRFARSFLTAIAYLCGQERSCDMRCP